MYPYYHHHEGIGWIGAMIVSSIIHGVIYELIFKMMNHLSLTVALFVGVLLIGVAVLVCIVVPPRGVRAPTKTADFSGGRLKRRADRYR